MPKPASLEGECWGEENSAQLKQEVTLLHWAMVTSSTWIILRFRQWMVRLQTWLSWVLAWTINVPTVTPWDILLLARTQWKIHVFLPIFFGQNDFYLYYFTRILFLSTYFVTCQWQDCFIICCTRKEKKVLICSLPGAWSIQAHKFSKEWTKQSLNEFFYHF